MTHFPGPCGAPGASTRPRYEVAQIIRDHAGQLRPESLSAEQRQVLEKFFPGDEDRVIRARDEWDRQIKVVRDTGATVN